MTYSSLSSQKEIKINVMNWKTTVSHDSRQNVLHKFNLLFFVSKVESCFQTTG